MAATPDLMGKPSESLDLLATAFGASARALGEGPLP
jgi:hypothetical protein